MISFTILEFLSFDRLKSYISKFGFTTSVSKIKTILVFEEILVNKAGVILFSNTLKTINFEQGCKLTTIATSVYAKTQNLVSANFSNCHELTILPERLFETSALFSHM